MGRGERLVLLAVLGTGVFLAGLELMITAVALPAILADLASWTELRQASWIVSAYLLVSVVAMPLAGRLADRVGARRCFLGALAIFTVGSLASGAADSLDSLIAGRALQAAGGGALVPVATAAVGHLYRGPDRARALGVIGALTFLGMAVGPFAGAAILELVDPVASVGAAPLLAPAWRWVFYVNVPLGIVALALGWAASAGWETPRSGARVDLGGALLFSLALGAGLLAITLADDRSLERLVDPAAATTALGAAALLLGIGWLLTARRSAAPFLDPRLLRGRGLGAAVLVALLTGYAFATAIVGAAVFVDRVLYGGPASQRVVLGALAGSTALGALLAGPVLRRLPVRVLTLLGVALCVVGLVAMGGWAPGTSLATAAAALALFGLGFGSTVTARSTAALEAVGREAYGLAGAAVTVARMLGMAVGLAVLSAWGSTVIERLSADVYASPEAYRAYIPAELRDRPLRDPFVVDALEAWAAREAAGVMVRLFGVAALVSAVALLPAARLPAMSASGESPDEPGTILGTDG